jgi:hypothetical protein
LDYEIQKGAIPVEVKNVDGLIFRDQWRSADSDGDDDIIPPMHIMLQLQAQMGCTNADHGFIVVAIGGNRLARVKIERHEPTQARIGEAVDLFWKSVVAGARPDWLADMETVRELLLDGEKDNPPAELANDADANRDARRYLRWQAHAKFVDGHLDRIKAGLALKVGLATRATLEEHSISWPMSGRPAKMIPAKWQDEMKWRGGFTVRKKGAK